MKVLLSVLIFPVLLFAQMQPAADSIMTKNGKISACNVESIEEATVHAQYQNTALKIPSESIARIYVDGMGAVYNSVQGFSAERTEINKFISARRTEFEKKIQIEMQKAEELKAARMKLEESKVSSTISMPVPEFSDNKDVSLRAECHNKNLWSFGVLWIPYYSGTTYTVTSTSTGNRPSLQVNSTAVTTSMLESNFSYMIMPRLRLTLNVGYTADNDKVESETHEAYIGSENNSYSNYASTSTDNLKKFVFEVGLKYYFAGMFDNKASAYVIAGAGKQFAFAKKEYSSTNQTTGNEKFEYNDEEFLEDMNSPFHLSVGFGAEYAFNDFLTLNSNIRIKYSAYSATAESRSILPTFEYTSKYKYERSDIVTNVGLGLNFYF